MSEDFDKFRKKVELQRPADNAKMFVVGFLVLSVATFAAVGEQAARSVIWYWAGFMALLLLGCAIQDIVIARKVKKL